MKNIAILGSTGSIGTQTLDVVRANRDIEVRALAAGRNIRLLEEQIREFGPQLAAVWEEEQAKELALRVRDLDVRVVRAWRASWSSPLCPGMRFWSQPLWA